uniref:C2H2-type domain-containing protein n=1 Tax=Pundamilia nyererei TaxID=303518 RepID=A0A3B4GW91_9CICH
HQLIHSGVKAHSCDFCGKSFSLAESLKTHQLIHSEFKAYCCDLCGKSFTLAISLKRHQLTHSGIKAYSCDICGKNFSQPERVQLIGKCRVCIDRRSVSGFVICDVLKMLKEFPDLHCLYGSSSQPYKMNYCKECGRGFPTSSALKKHVLIHSGVKKYVCDQCGSSFTTAGELKVHKRVHTGEKPYKCRHCDKSFSRSSSHNLHERTHMEENFSCDQWHQCDHAGLKSLDHNDSPETERSSSGFRVRLKNFEIRLHRVHLESPVKSAADVTLGCYEVALISGLAVNNPGS